MVINFHVVTARFSETFLPNKKLQSINYKFRNLTLTYDSTKSDWTEAPKIQGIEKFDVHLSTVCVIKACAIVHAWVGGTWIYQD